MNSVAWLVTSLQIQNSNNADVLLDSGLNFFFTPVCQSFCSQGCLNDALPVSLPDPMFLLRGSFSLVPYSWGGGGLSRGFSVGRPLGIRKAGGTHLTGVLSCFYIYFADCEQVAIWKPSGIPTRQTLFLWQETSWLHILNIWQVKA